jgi:RNA polymerase sigma-70 factor (ECF subfamily)
MRVVDRAERSTFHRALGGDRDGLKALLKRHGPAVRRQLSGRIPARWQALLSVDDVMQQTYTDAFLKIAQLPPDRKGAFPAWLSSIARHNLIDAVRMLEADKRGQGKRVPPGKLDESFVALHDLLSSGGTSPSGRAARGEVCAVLRRAVDQLPEDYRRVVELYDLEGRPMQEAAEALGRSVGAAYMVRARAHRKLRAFLGSASDYFTAA